MDSIISPHEEHLNIHVFILHLFYLSSQIALTGKKFVIYSHCQWYSFPGTWFMLSDSGFPQIPWFPPAIKTDHPDITEMLLTVALNTISFVLNNQQLAFVIWRKY